MNPPPPVVQPAVPLGPTGQPIVGGPGGMLPPGPPMGTGGQVGVIPVGG